MLREYVYLDRNRIEDFLSQLEGGVSDTSRRSKTSADAEVEAGLSIGIAKLGSKVSTPSVTQEELHRITDVALFERLYSHLESRGLDNVSNVEDVNWEQLRRGTILELDGSVVVSGFTKLSETMGDLQQMASLMGETRLEGVEGIGALFGSDIGARFLLEETAVAYTSLVSDSLRSPLADIEGDCTALVRVRKTVRSGRRTPIRAVAGLRLRSSQLEELLNTIEDPPPELGFNLVAEDLIAKGPCAIVTTVAIYR